MWWGEATHACACFSAAKTHAQGFSGVNRFTYFDGCVVGHFLQEIRRQTVRDYEAAFDAVVDAETDARVGPNAKAVRNREQTRFVSVSQPLAGMWKLDVRLKAGSASHVSFCI